jgi:hypothetical protein
MTLPNEQLACRFFGTSDAGFPAQITCFVKFHRRNASEDGEKSAADRENPAARRTARRPCGAPWQMEMCDLWRLQAEFLDPITNLVAVHSEQRRGLRLIPAGAFQSLHDEITLQLFKIHAGSAVPAEAPGSVRQAESRLQVLSQCLSKVPGDCRTI